MCRLRLSEYPSLIKPKQLRWLGQRLDGMVDAAETPDTSDGGAEDAFAIGAVVHDREDDNPNDAIVVNRPSKTATEWIARRGSWSEKTVAEDNPEYPADAPVIVVVFADALQAAFPDWEEDAPLALTAINESDASHYSFPAPRLRRIDSSPGDESPPTASNEQEPAAAPDTADDGVVPASDEPPVTAADLSASMRALKERLEDGGMTVESESDGQALQATKLGDTYRVRPGEIIKGDGALRAQLASIVDEYE